MQATEIRLSGPQPLAVHGRAIAMVECQDGFAKDDALPVRFQTGVELVLPAAVDVSQQIDEPRVFVIEGRPAETFLVLGGPTLYWLTISGTVERSMAAMRDPGLEEHWRTRTIARELDLVVICESEVIVVDERLNVRCHKPKHLNDEFLAIDGDLVTFARDGDGEWSMRLDDSVPAVDPEDPRDPSP